MYKHNFLPIFLFLGIWLSQSICTSISSSSSEEWLDARSRLTRSDISLSESESLFSLFGWICIESGSEKMNVQKITKWLSYIQICIHWISYVLNPSHDKYVRQRFVCKHLKRFNFTFHYFNMGPCFVYKFIQRLSYLLVAIVTYLFRQASRDCIRTEVEGRLYVGISLEAYFLTLTYLYCVNNPPLYIDRRYSYW